MAWESYRRRGAVHRHGRAASLLATIALMTVGLTGLIGGAPPAQAQTTDDTLCHQPVDVLLLFDTTGSMGDVLEDAKAGASDIVSNVQAQASDTRFGVANYRDYPGSFSYPGYSATYGADGDYPWQHDLSFTSSTSTIQSAVDGLSIGSGADAPESVSRALHESRHLGWRTDAVKLVVLFADAPPHDLDFNGQNTGGDPGPDATAQTADDLDFETEVSQLAADGIRTIVVDSGSHSGAPAYFQHMADETGGAYEDLGTDLVDQVTELILQFLPAPLTDGRAVAVDGDLSVPVNPHIEVNPVQETRANAETSQPVAHEEVPGVATVTAANDGARTAQADSEIGATANTTIAEVDLLGGLIHARGLHGVVQSNTSLSAGSSSQVLQASIAELTVAGTPINTDVPRDTVVPVPGGVVILKETATAEHGPEGSEVLLNLVHVVLDRPEARLDIVIGQAFAASGCDDLVLTTLLATHDNDAGTGGDAGDTPGQATPLATPTIVQGRTVDDGDARDHYAVHVEPGEKLSAVLVPSSRATATVGPVGSSPQPGASLPDHDLILREPGTFAVREESRLPGSAPERVELNVDRPGDWVLEVDRSTDVPGNYTLAVTVTPIPLLPQNDALSGGDAPDACRAGGVPVDTGVHPGVLKGDDRVDTFEVHADIGDELAVTLKPTEDADGADFDLYLYDGDCNRLQSSTLGKGLIPKGTPETVNLLPVQASDDYILEVVRVNGIGDYYLAVASQDPQPTVGPLDSEPSGDAGSDDQNAEPFMVPGAGQGSFPDGDTIDWYAVDLTDGQTLRATLAPSALSDLDLALIRPDGTTVEETSASPGASPEVLTADIDATGTWYLEVTRTSGGGDYILAAGAS